MHIPFVDLFAQYIQIKEKIDSAIADVLRKSSFIGGEYVRSFESEWAQIHNLSHCISTANGTDSIEILLQAYGIGKGDEVIVPSHSWISTAEAVVTAGATPVFADTLDRRYTIDPARVEEKITQRTKAIIPVHLYGLPADMDPILQLAKKYNLRVIEDCAQAHLARYKGRMVGTMGDAASFSFYPGKNLGAYGDAGAIVTNNDEIAALCRRIANHGQLQKHNHLIPGRNSRLDGLQAAILLTKLPFLEQWTKLRIANANTYRTLLDNRLKFTITPEGYEHVYHLFVVQVEEREKVINSLKEKGIETAIHYPVPMPLMEAFKDIPKKNGDYEVNRAYATKILSIPMFPELTAQQIEYIASALNSSYAKG